MSALRAVLRPLYDTPFGDRLRAWIGANPPINLRPRVSAATVSDLFPWRVDAIWETCFELLNLPSLLFPDQAPVDRATLVLFDTGGRECGRKTFDLLPFETHRIALEPLLNGVSGVGSFACFHASPCLSALTRHGSHLSERGYVGFRRRGDVLWSYAHGNLHVLAAPPGGALAPIGAPTRGERVYRPQLRFGDSKSFDLIYVNPVSRPVELSVCFLGSEGREVGRVAVDLPVRGTTIISRATRTGAIEWVESRARCSLWRPLVFKSYESHFDVFHA